MRRRADREKDRRGEARRVSGVAARGGQTQRNRQGRAERENARGVRRESGWRSERRNTCASLPLVLLSTSPLQRLNTPSTCIGPRVGPPAGTASTSLRTPKKGAKRSPGTKSGTCAESPRLPHSPLRLSETGGRLGKERGGERSVGDGRRRFMLHLRRLAVMQQFRLERRSRHAALFQEV